MSSTFHNVELDHVYDGDTIFVNLNCSDKVFCKNIGVRVLGIDTPEMKSKDSCEKRKAKEAKKYVEKHLQNKEIKLQNIKRGKYFRIVADVIVDNNSISKGLLEERLAVPYNGGKKPKVNWCGDNPVIIKNYH